MTPVLKRVLGEAAGYRGHLAGILLLSLASAPIALLIPVPIQVVVDSVIGNAPIPGWLSAVLPTWIMQSRETLLLTAVLLLIGFTLLQQLEGFGSWLLQLYTGEKLVLRFRARLFEHAQKLSLAYHDRAGTADTLYRIQYDAAAVQYLIASGLIPLITAAVTVLAMLIVILCISPSLGVIAALVAPALAGLTEWYRGRIRGRWIAVKEQESQALAIVQEVLGSLRVVKAFAQQSRERKRFVQASTGVLNAQLRTLFAEAGFGLTVSIVLAFGTAAVLYLGAEGVRQGEMSLGQLVLVLTYLAQLYKPLETISKKVASLQSSIVSAARAYTLLDQAPDVPEPAPHCARHIRGSVFGNVVLDKVSFGYVPDHLVLRNVSLNVPARSWVGIMGPTGAGKTTLVNVISRFHDPTKGRVLLDGIDMRDIPVDDLRRQFSIVLQEPVLFSTSIAENIGYARPQASRAEIEAAARAANAHGFIMRLPEGYDTILGERGMTLSGGERQRVSIARAFLKYAPILILDEPTSAVDAASEAAIMGAIARLMCDRTTFVIAHRTSTLYACDLFVSVAGGQVKVIRDRTAGAGLPTRVSQGLTT
jgi:ATP-binding cassette subfamily B protein